MGLPEGGVQGVGSANVPLEVVFALAIRFQVAPPSRVYSTVTGTAVVSMGCPAAVVSVPVVFVVPVLGITAGFS